VKYGDDYKQQVRAAFERALRRFDTERREPDGWEGRCLLDALAAMANGSYGWAAEHIERCFGPSRPPHAEPSVIDLTVAGLRASFDMVTGGPDVRRRPVAAA
jgi:hypothetical protein